MGEENDATNPFSHTSFQNCLTIDDALCNLYQPALPIDKLNELTTSSRHESIPSRKPSYDWLLDGYDSDPDNCYEDTKSESDNIPERTQFETFNEEGKVMNNLLNKMELENTPLKTTSSTTNFVDYNSDEEQEWGDFVSAFDDQNEPQSNLDNIEKDTHNIHQQTMQIESYKNIMQGVDHQMKNSISKNQNDCNDFVSDSITKDQDNSHNENTKIRNNKEKKSEIEKSQTEKSGDGSKQSSFPNSSSSKDNDEIAPLSSSSFLIMNKLAIPSMESLEGRFIRRIMLDQNDFDEDEDESDEFQIDGSSTTNEWWQRTEKRMEMDLPPEYYTYVTFFFCTFLNMLLLHIWNVAFLNHIALVRFFSLF